MFDTMTFTKVVGAVCGSLLIYLMAKWGAELLYHPAHGSYDEAHAKAYVIETGSDEPAEPEVELPIEEILAAGDAGSGERVFNACRACHKLADGENGTGPHLYGVVGRNIGAVDGFSYSGALTEQAEVWTAENLYAFLEDPRGWAPGTSMSYSGLGRSEDRANLIAYLDSIDD